MKLGKNKLIGFISIIAILFSLQFINAQVFNGGVFNTLWFPNSEDKLEPVDTAWGIYTAQDLDFDGELLPDGSTCSNSQILKKTGTDNWDCAADNDTTYTAGGTLLDLTGTTFSINEGTLTDEKLCNYQATGTQIECLTDNNATNWDTAYTHSQDNSQAHSDYLLNTGDTGAGNYIFTGTFTHQNTVDSTTAFQVLDADGGNPVLVVDTTNERVGVGLLPTMGQALQIRHSFAQIGDDGDFPTWQITSYSDTGFHGFFQNPRRARGTRSSPTIVGSTDIIFSNDIWGYDGSNFVKGAQFIASMNGTASTDIVPMRISLATMDTTGALAERIRLHNSGRLGINDTNPDAMLEVVSNATTEEVIKAKGAASQTGDLYRATNSSDTVLWSIGATGQALFQNSTDSTTGFQIMDADGGTPIINIDTTNERVGIGTASPARNFHIFGEERIQAIGDNTADRTLLSLQSSTGGDRGTITIGNNATYGEDILWKSNTGISFFIDNSDATPDRSFKVIEGSVLGEIFKVSPNGDTTIGYGVANKDISITVVGETNTGIITWMEDEDYFASSDDWLFNTSEKQYFRDTAIGIYSQADTFMDLFADGGVRIGDSSAGAPTNYTNFAPDGELTQVGTARVKKEISLNVTDLNPGASGPTAAVHGNYSSYEFTISDDMYAEIEVPYDWDSTTDLEISVYWAIDEAYATNSGEVQWYTDWSATATGEAITAPTHTGNIDFGDVNIPAVANTLVKTTGTISAASLAAGDLLGFHGSRVALDAGSNPTAEPYIVNVEIEYTSNKLGEPT